MKTLLWLDDCRDPMDKEIDWMIFSCLGRNCNIIWVKTYRDFIKYIQDNGLPDGINFDHDIENFHISKSSYIEKTGFDCAKWLVNYCIDNKLKLPKWYTHSANPVGKANIDGLLTNFKEKYKY